MADSPVNPTPPLVGNVVSQRSPSGRWKLWLGGVVVFVVLAAIFPISRLGSGRQLASLRDAGVTYVRGKTVLFWGVGSLENRRVSPKDLPYPEERGLQRVAQLDDGTAGVLLRAPVANPQALWWVTTHGADRPLASLTEQTASGERSVILSASRHPTTGAVAYLVQSTSPYTQRGPRLQRYTFHLIDSVGNRTVPLGELAGPLPFSGDPAGHLALIGWATDHTVLLVQSSDSGFPGTGEAVLIDTSTGESVWRSGISKGDIWPLPADNQLLVLAESEEGREHGSSQTCLHRVSAEHFADATLELLPNSCSEFPVRIYDALSSTSIQTGPVVLYGTSEALNVYSVKTQKVDVVKVSASADTNAVLGSQGDRFFVEQTIITNCRGHWALQCFLAIDSGAYSTTTIYEYRLDSNWKRTPLYRF